MRIFRLIVIPFALSLSNVALAHQQTVTVIDKVNDLNWKPMYTFDIPLDTVQLKVHLVKYIATPDKTSEGAIFDESARLSIIPVKAIKASLIPRLFNEPELSNFNGLFLDGSDDVLVWGYLLSKETGKSISYYYDLVKQSGISTSFSDYKEVPSTGSISFSYAIHVLDISFLKITLEKSSLNARMLAKYKKEVPTSNGNYFYIYVPVKVLAGTKQE